MVGEGTLRDLVAEAKATTAARKARVRIVLEGSYSHHYRMMLPKLLRAGRSVGGGTHQGNAFAVRCCWSALSVPPGHDDPLTVLT